MKAQRTSSVRDRFFL